MALVTAVIFAPFALIYIDPHHDGIMLKPALDVLSGQVLFRDTFSQYGPLTTYLQAVALMVSPTLAALRLLTVIAYAGSAGLFYLTWRGFLPRSLALVASGIFILVAPFYHPEWAMIPWSSTLALFFQAVAMLAFVRIVAGERGAYWAWMVGIGCAGTFWCRQPVGIALMGSLAVIGVALHMTGWRTAAGNGSRLWGRVAMGFGVITVLILGHLAIQGAAGAWWEQNILWPRRWAAGDAGVTFGAFARFFLSTNSALILAGVILAVFLPDCVRRFYRALPRWVNLGWLGLCFAAYLALGATLRANLLIEIGGWRMVILAVLLVQAFWVVLQAFRRGKAPSDPNYYQVAAMSGLVLASVAQVYPVACANHVFWALAPGFGLFVYFIHRNLRCEPALLVVSMLALLSPAIYEKYNWGIYKLSLPYVTLEQPAVLAGMKVAPSFAGYINNVQRIIAVILQGNPEQKVILYGDDALYLTWFKNRENPSPYYVSWRRLGGPEHEKARWEFLIREKPVVILNGANAVALKAIPVDYRLVLHEPHLALRIMVPAHVAPQLTEVQIQLD